jgi:hypothetical protein
VIFDCNASKHPFHDQFPSCWIFLQHHFFKHLCGMTKIWNRLWKVETSKPPSIKWLMIEFEFHRSRFFFNPKSVVIFYKCNLQ